MAFQAPKDTELKPETPNLATLADDITTSLERLYPFFDEKHSTTTHTEYKTLRKSSSTCPVPFSISWVYLIDGKDSLTRGPNDYDQDEPGYGFRMQNALEWVFRTIDAPVTAAFIKELNNLTIPPRTSTIPSDSQYFFYTGARIEKPQWGEDNFAEMITWGWVKIGGWNPFEQRPINIRPLIPKSINTETACQFLTGLIPPNDSPFLSDFTTELESNLEEAKKLPTSADRKTAALHAIVLFGRKVDLRHCFPDGNTRTARLLIEKLLIENGFPLTVFYNPNHLEEHCTTQLLQEIRAGFIDDEPADWPAPPWRKYTTWSEQTWRNNTYEALRRVFKLFENTKCPPSVEHIDRDYYERSAQNQFLAELKRSPRLSTEDSDRLQWVLVQLGYQSLSLPCLTQTISTLFQSLLQNAQWECATLLIRCGFKTNQLSFDPWEITPSFPLKILTIIPLEHAGLLQAFTLSVFSTLLAHLFLETKTDWIAALKAHSLIQYHRETFCRTLLNHLDTLLPKISEFDLSGFTLTDTLPENSLYAQPDLNPSPASPLPESLLFYAFRQDNKEWIEKLHTHGIRLDSAHLEVATLFHTVLIFRYDSPEELVALCQLFIKNEIPINLLYRNESVLTHLITSYHLDPLRHLALFNYLLTENASFIPPLDNPTVISSVSAHWRFHETKWLPFLERAVQQNPSLANQAIIKKFDPKRCCDRLFSLRELGIGVDTDSKASADQTDSVRTASGVLLDPAKRQQEKTQLLPLPSPRCFNALTIFSDLHTSAAPIEDALQRQPPIHSDGPTVEDEARSHQSLCAQRLSQLHDKAPSLWPRTNSTLPLLLTWIEPERTSGYQDTLHPF